MKGVFVGIAVVALFGCGGSGGSSTGPAPNPGVNTPPPADGISVNNNSFSPANKAITAGSTVRWAWNSCTGDPYYGQTCTAHSVTFDDGTGSVLQNEGTFSKTFATPGTYNYHCSSHGAAMAGTITVQ